ncbi:STAS domain-containing protein [Jannaschia marina]|uniref:STAS domain-containing protein n=1 Tax=Jannaschia marina TaxID=2741674 RepID=UPI0015CCBE5A|nr:STAS domain-containing protein [Jannaschia marina]
MTAPGTAGETIVLPERLDMAAAIRLRDDLLARAGDLALDASAVVHVTTPGLQILMAARDHQGAQDRALAITAPSSGFLDAIGTLGVSLDRLRTGGPV